MFSLLAHSVGFGAATEKVVPRILPSPAVSAQTPKVYQRSCVSSTATVYHLQESLDLTGIFSWSGMSRLFRIPRLISALLKSPPYGALV